MSAYSPVIEERLYCPADLRLWRAADDVTEYRLRLNTVTSEYHADLHHVIYQIQEAAKAAAKEDNAGTLDALMAASKSTTDADVILGIYRLIVSLGYDCPKHGAETWVIEGGPRLIAGEVVKDPDHTYCAFCDEEVFPAALEISLPVADLSIATF
jgi:hypothetical protein